MSCGSQRPSGLSGCIGRYCCGLCFFLFAFLTHMDAVFMSRFTATRSKPRRSRTKPFGEIWSQFIVKLFSAGPDIGSFAYSITHNTRQKEFREIPKSLGLFPDAAIYEATSHSHAAGRQWKSSIPEALILTFLPYLLYIFPRKAWISYGALELL